MIDISAKCSTLRTATAEAVIRVPAATLQRVRRGEVPKGDPLAVARVAAIQAAKNTSQLIPYCHPLPIEFVGVEFDLGEDTIRVRTTVKAVHKTGVEMEALTAASVAALTVYDMLKALDREMEIGSIRLLSKRGGRSDLQGDHVEPLRAAVVVLSDSVAAGRKQDESGKAIVSRLEEIGVTVADYRILPDDAPALVSLLKEYADAAGLDLVLTTGGTGFGPRDTTPEAMAQVIDREAPGIAEALRAYGQARTPRAMLSRGRAGIRGRTLIVNLPGSRQGVIECLDALFPGVLHAFPMLRGEGHPRQEAQP